MPKYLLTATVTQTTPDAIRPQDAEMYRKWLEDDLRETLLPTSTLDVTVEEVSS